MNARERIQSIRLLNQISRQPEYSKQIGLSYQIINKKGGKQNAQNQK